MKLGILLAIMAMAGCKTPDPAPVTEVKRSVDPQEIALTTAAAEVKLSVTADGDWGVYSADKEWVNVTPSGGVAGTADVKVKVGENKSYDVRETEIVFTTKSGKTSVPVKQDGVEYVEPPFVVPEGYALVWQDEFD